MTPVLRTKPEFNVPTGARFFILIIVCMWVTVMLEQLAGVQENVVELLLMVQAANAAGAVVPLTEIAYSKPIPVVPVVPPPLPSHLPVKSPAH